MKIQSKIFPILIGIVMQVANGFASEITLTTIYYSDFWGGALNPMDASEVIKLVDKKTLGTSKVTITGGLGASKVEDIIVSSQDFEKNKTNSEPKDVRIVMRFQFESGRTRDLVIDSQLNGVWLSNVGVQGIAREDLKILLGLLPYHLYVYTIEGKSP